MGRRPGRRGRRRPAAATATWRTVDRWPWGRSISTSPAPSWRLGDGADVGGGELERPAQLGVEPGEGRSASSGADRSEASGASVGRSARCSAGPPRRRPRAPARWISAGRRGREPRRPPTSRRGSRRRSRSAPAQSKRRTLIGRRRLAQSRHQLVDLGARAACGRRGWRRTGRCTRRSPRAPRGRSLPACGRWRPGRRSPSPSPISGASSTEPLTSITSTWRPVCSK